MSDVIPILAQSTLFEPLTKLTDRFLDLPTWKASIGYIDDVHTSFFPFLAEQLGIAETAAWQKSLNDSERIKLIKGAYARQRLRGTPAGLKQEALEAGGLVRRIIAPPNKTFLSASPTVSERNAWLSQHPELRMYPRRVPGQKEVAMTQGDFVGACFIGKSTALIRSRLRVTLVKDKVETELETVSFELANLQKQFVNEVVIPGQRGFASFLGQSLRFVSRTDANLRRIILNQVDLYHEPTAQMSLKTIPVGYEAINSEAEAISEIRQAPASATLLGRFARFSLRMQSELAQYYRIKLFDPSVPVVKARAASHLGYSRLTMPPHCAHVEVAFFGKRDLTMGRFVGRPVARGNRDPLNKLLNAMRLAARGSDSITINTKIFKPAKFGRFKMGQVIAGGLSNT